MKECAVLLYCVKYRGGVHSLYSDRESPGTYGYTSHYTTQSITNNIVIVPLRSNVSIATGSMAMQ